MDIKETCFDWFGASYSVRKSQLKNRTESSQLSKG